MFDMMELHCVAIRFTQITSLGRSLQLPMDASDLGFLCCNRLFDVAQRQRICDVSIQCNTHVHTPSCCLSESRRWTSTACEYSA